MSQNSGGSQTDSEWDDGMVDWVVGFGGSIGWVVHLKVDCVDQSPGGSGEEDLSVSRGLGEGGVSGVSD